MAAKPPRERVMENTKQKPQAQLGSSDQTRQLVRRISIEDIPYDRDARLPLHRGIRAQWKESQGYPFRR
jgi:hypothetical protein